MLVAIVFKEVRLLLILLVDVGDLDNDDDDLP